MTEEKTLDEMTLEMKLAKLDEERPADVNSSEFWKWCGRKGGLMGKRKLSKKEAKRMVNIREQKRHENMMGPHCLKCGHMDNDTLLCSLKKCMRKEIDGILNKG